MSTETAAGHTGILRALLLTGALALTGGCGDDGQSPDGGPASGDSGEQGGEDGGDGTATLPEPVTAELPAPRLARRMSLDLRGRLPDVAELDAVEADPAALEGLVEDWLLDEAFGERVVDLYAERWLTRVDDFPVSAFEAGFADEEEHAFEQAVGEEPLRLVAWVATSDAPYEALVTADHTMANELLADLWGLDYPEEARDGGSGGWAVARYTDGRPAAGVLATNGLWWRYTTTTFNYNRTRAAALSRLLLCYDYLARPVEVTASPALLDVDGTEAALRSDPGCQACHASLDPLAANLFGFWWYDLFDLSEASTYHAEREPLGESLLELEAAYFGAPVTDLAHLGQLVGADPRFRACAAETVAESLWRRESTLRDHPTLAALQADFEAEGRTIRSLVRGVLQTPEYRAGSLLPEASDEDAARERVVRLLPPELLASALADAADYEWRWEGFEQLGNDDIGYRAMAGGVDGDLVTVPQPVPSPGWILTTRVVAEAAAGWALDGAAEPPWLAQGVAGLAGAVPGEDAADAVLSELHWRLYAERAEASWLAEVAELHAAVAAEADPDTAWEVVLAALLQDPRFLTY